MQTCSKLGVVSHWRGGHCSIVGVLTAALVLELFDGIVTVYCRRKMAAQLSGLELRCRRIFARSHVPLLPFRPSYVCVGDVTPRWRLSVFSCDRFFLFIFATRGKMLGKFKHNAENLDSRSCTMFEIGAFYLFLFSSSRFRYHAELKISVNVV